ncbi:MAG: ABC transporter substrate-binding protein [Geminicoccaceae bacterium]|nr:MAG: ABC transporter substrate-binding protein [Geminicoccaceae bacterium]
MRIHATATLAAAAALFATTTAGAETIRLNVSGLVSTHIHHTALERAFFEGLAERTGLDVRVNFNPLDVIGVTMDDTMRMAGDGTFDIVQSTIGSVARDDTFLEGMDLMGVSPTLADLREAVDAFRPALTARAEERLNVKVLAVWPFGQQHVFCKEPISSLTDLRGKRVRSFSRSMSAVLEYVGATPVSMPFAEVYPALQRGVVECAITSITSANSGSWPEITTHVLAIALSNGINAHFMNLDSWNALSPEAQEAFTEAFKEAEDAFWDLTESMYDDAMRCSTGLEPCEHYNRFNMTRVDPSEADLALLAEAVDNVVLDVWANACQPRAECVEIWNATVGAVRGFEMAAN